MKRIKDLQFCWGYVFSCQTLFSFSLERKRNKKFKAIRCGTFFKLTISSAESPVARVILLADP